jgi:hypothetical protein
MQAALLPTPTVYWTRQPSEGHPGAALNDLRVKGKLDRALETEERAASRTRILQ